MGPSRLPVRSYHHNLVPIDQYYENLRTGMRQLFTALGVAA